MNSAAIIADQPRRHCLHVFSDEMYRLLEYDAATRLAPVADLYERGISLSGLSKSFALPGLRIGWLAMQDAGSARPLHHVPRLHDHQCNGAQAEILGIMAFAAQEQIVARNLAIIGRNQDQDSAVLRPVRRPLHLAAAAGRLSRLPAASRRTARGRVLPGCAGPTAT